MGAASLGGAEMTSRACSAHPTSSGTPDSRASRILRGVCARRVSASLMRLLDISQTTTKHPWCPGCSRLLAQVLSRAGCCARVGLGTRYASSAVTYITVLHHN